MERCFQIAALVLHLWTVVTLQPVEKVANYPLGCTLRQYNFTAKLTDENGKKCRARISTKACFGSCESFEYGTHDFPFIISVSPTCNYESVKEVSMALTDCDTGASSTIQTFKFYEALSCVCKELLPTEEHRIAIPSKRDELIYDVNYEDEYDEEKPNDFNSR